jgi:uncharacterized membrane-anchored protein
MTPLRDRILLVLGLVLILGIANYGIASRERLRSSGRTVFLELAPVDPRSLMQGDYMALRYQIENSHPGARAYLVVAVDERNIGKLVPGASAPTGPNQIRIRCRLRDDGRPHIGANAYFFEEGTSRLYDLARYGEFRVDPSGDALLIGLRDRDLRPLGPLSR